MRSWLHPLRALRRKPASPRPAPVRKARPAVERLEDRCLLSAGAYLQTNLVSDGAIPAQFTDPQLVNPWGLVAGPTTPWWAADDASGFSTLYSGAGVKQGLVVTIPPNPTNPISPIGRPTGVVFNTSGAGFDVSENGKSGSSRFIFDSFDGTLSGWNPGVDLNHAIVAVNNPGNVYTGLAIDTDASNNTFLYAADFKHGTIDVYDSGFNKVDMAFQDRHIPTGYHPFNIQNIDGKLYVAYAIFNPATNFDVPGEGHGFVDVFDAHGNLEQRLIRHGQLDSPWALAQAPADFGEFSGDLLVGNFGNGHINAYDPHDGHFVGTLRDASGQPIAIEHLWALQFGNGAAAGPKNTLFFTEGVQFGKHGLFGTITPLPEKPDNDAADPDANEAQDRAEVREDQHQVGDMADNSGNLAQRSDNGTDHGGGTGRSAADDVASAVNMGVLGSGGKRHDLDAGL